MSAKHPEGEALCIWRRAAGFTIGDMVDTYGCTHAEWVAWEIGLEPIPASIKAQTIGEPQ